MQKTLLLLASAHAHVLSLEAEPDAKPQKVTNGLCQYAVGTYIFDLLKFDSIGSKEHPTSQEVASDQTFHYKVCQNTWEIEDAFQADAEAEDADSVDIDLLEAACSEKSIAFLTGVDGDENPICKNSFERPTFLPIANDDEDSVDAYKGFSLTYTAQYEEDDEVMCQDGEPLTVQINAICNKGGSDEFSYSTVPQFLNDPCKFQLNYEGDTACAIYDIDISKYFSGLNKFMGVISLILGLVLALYGSKFIVIVFGFLVFMITQLFMWGILYNTKIFKPEEVEEKKGLIIGLGVGIALLGGVAAYYLAKFADKFAVSLISVWCGGILAFMIIGGFHMPGYAKLIFVGIFAGAAGYYSYKIQRFVKSAGTALIGSFIFFYGVGRYVDGYPQIFQAHTADGDDQAVDQAALEELNDEKHGPMALFFLGGTVVFAILGTWFQMTYVSPPKQEEDDFMNEKDS